MSEDKSNGSFQLTRKQLEQLVLDRTQELSIALEDSTAVKEQLNEMLLDVVHAQEKAEERLREAENLLSGLSVLNLSLDSGRAMQYTVTLLRGQLDYEHAFLLSVESDNSLSVLSSTSSIFDKTVWHPQQFFSKVLDGATIPVFDVSLIPEWAEQGSLEGVVSALHIPLRTGHSGAVLVCTHSERGFFTQRHADIAQRFSVLATQSLLIAELLEELRQERDTLEQRVDERTREITAILDVQPDTIFQISDEGVIKDCRKSEGVDLHIAPEEFIGRNMAEFIPEQITNKYLAATLLANKTEEVQVIEYDLVIRGNKYSYEARLAVSKGASDNFVFVRDITHRKKAEKELRFERSELALRVEERTTELQTMNAELQRAVEAKDKFLATVTHELRTPLNVILGATEAMEDNIYGPLNTNQLQSVGRISQSGYQLLELINDILDVARIDSEQLALNIKPTNVTSVCQSCVEMIGEVARGRNINVEFESCKSTVSAMVDELRLRQILMNLLGNAVKFTDEGGSVGSKLNFDSENETLSIAIWDTGIGIAEENVDKLFKHFVQLDSGLSRQYQGSGLGLALVRRLAIMHGGDVSVKSELGVGSTFTVTLPWKKV